MNIEQMTQKTREALQAAQRIAVEYSNNAVEQEHLLAALAQQQDGLIPQLLQTLGIDANAFAQAALQKVEALPRVTGSGRDPEKIYISNDLDRALNAAKVNATQSNAPVCGHHRRISSGISIAASHAICVEGLRSNSNPGL